MESHALTEIRWEYRCWPSPDRLTAIRASFDTWHKQTEPPRTDIYLLTPGGGAHLAKLRGGARLEIKQRLNRTDRLEKWGMRRSTDFPLPKGVFDGIDGLSGLDGPFPSPRDLLAAISERNDISAVTVEKSRTLYRQDDHQGEITGVAVRGRSFTTVGFESQCAQRLAAIASGAPFAGLENLDYGAFIQMRLKEAARWPAN